MFINDLVQELWAICGYKWISIIFNMCNLNTNRKISLCFCLMKIFINELLLVNISFVILLVYDIHWIVLFVNILRTYRYVSLISIQRVSNIESVLRMNQHFLRKLFRQSGENWESEIKQCLDVINRHLCVPFKLIELWDSLHNLIKSIFW